MTTMEQDTSTSQVRFLVGVTVLLCIITVAAVVIITVARPNNANAVTVIIALMTPILIALLGAGLHSVSTSINGRMTQLISATAEKEHVKGIVEGLIVNPNTSLQASDLPGTRAASTIEQVRSDVKLKSDPPKPEPPAS